MDKKIKLDIQYENFKGKYISYGTQRLTQYVLENILKTIPQPD